MISGIILVFENFCFKVVFLMKKINIGIIFGGKSSEHEVSRTSAQAIVNNIRKDKYDIYPIGITKQGEWFLITEDYNKIGNGEWETSNSKRSAFISPDSSFKGLVVKDGNGKFEKIRLDAVIPVLHGKNGEDGTMQGLLELSQIPFVGCDTTSSAACMDKVITNCMLSYLGISKPAFNWFYAYDFEKDSEKCIRETEEIIKKYPMFIKPANAGSSVGVSKADNREELIEGIKKAAKEDQKILIEEGITGKEVECAILGNENPVASCVGEIAPSGGFYDYEAKYINDSSKLFIPARIPDNISEEIRKIAVLAYKVMGCSGLSRVDFFVEEGTDRVLLNEINTSPGFTSISMYPKLMKEIGVDFPDLIDQLINFALQRK